MIRRVSFIGRGRGRSKYNATRVDEHGQAILPGFQTNGPRFDSRAEWLFWQWIKARPSVDYVLRQVPFHLPGGIVYRCDFMAFERGLTLKTQERFYDVKGFRTATYKLKKRLVEAEYPVKIIEVQVRETKTLGLRVYFDGVMVDETRGASNG